MLGKTVPQTKSPDDSQSTANFIPAFVYIGTNLDFARNPVLVH